MLLQSPLTRCLATFAALCLASPSAQAVTMTWVTVGNPGNTCEPPEYPCLGLVLEYFQISRYEVTNAQYSEFLNAVAASDPNSLYTPLDITRTGSPGTYSYAPIAGKENAPVRAVSFWDACRFANWLHNGQPTGAQDATTTEDGAYTLTPTAVAANTVTRNPEALVFLPNVNEWYKAAFYDPVAMVYHDYAMGLDIAPLCTLPTAAPNHANCSPVTGGTTDVGRYPGSPSPYGTFDQAGNVYEWNETIVSTSYRGTRGGSFDVPLVTFLKADTQIPWMPTYEQTNIGFRVARSLSPAPSLAPLGMAILASLLGITAYWRLRG